jgi:hypothetical protein
MSSARYRLIDTAGGEIGIVDHNRTSIEIGGMVSLPDGTRGTVVDVYDDEGGREGRVTATLAVDEG